MGRKKRVKRRDLVGERGMEILSLLDPDREQTGWELGARDHSMPSGTIYTTLTRLEDAGLVVSRKQAGSGRPGPAPRYYLPTERGLLVVKAWHAFVAVLEAADSD